MGVPRLVKVLLNKLNILSKRFVVDDAAVPDPLAIMSELYPDIPIVSYRVGLLGVAIVTVTAVLELSHSPLGVCETK